MLPIVFASMAQRSSSKKGNIPVITININNGGERIIRTEHKPCHYASSRKAQSAHLSQGYGVRRRNTIKDTRHCRRHLCALDLDQAKFPNCGLITLYKLLSQPLVRIVTEGTATDRPCGRNVKTCDWISAGLHAYFHPVPVGCRVQMGGFSYLELPSFSLWNAEHQRHNLERCKVG